MTPMSDKTSNTDEAGRPVTTQPEGLAGMGKPTPTQAESDAHARGEHVLTHEADGSPEETFHNLPHDPRKPGARVAPEKSEHMPRPTPTQAEMDARSRGDHAGAAAAKEKAAEEDAEREKKRLEAQSKSAEADAKRASYKTRDAKPSTTEPK